MEEEFERDLLKSVISRLGKNARNWKKEVAEAEKKKYLCGSEKQLSTSGLHKKEVSSEFFLFSRKHHFLCCL